MPTKSTQKLKPHKDFKYPEVTDYTDFAPYDMPVEERRKLDVGDIFFNQVRHTVCGWYIRSRNRHDYRKCLCGKLAVDGGSWYQSITGDLEHAESHIIYYKDVDNERTSSEESETVS